MIRKLKKALSPRIRSIKISRYVLSRRESRIWKKRGA